MNVVFPDISFPHRGEFERSEFVNKQELAQDKLSDDFTTAIEDFQTQATALETNVTTKEANVVAKHDVVVEKEALMNPHYDEIDNVSNNMIKVSNLDTNMTSITTVNTNIADVVAVADNEANINTVATNVGSITSKIGVTDIHNATSKLTPLDADELAILDSANSFGLKKLTFSNLKATLLTYFDTLYSRTNAIIGINQTWQNMTSQRVSGATYTNTTDKPIMVSVYSMYKTGENSLYFYINGETVLYDYTYSSNPSRTVGVSIIPNGASYRVDYSAGSWFELR